LRRKFYAGQRNILTISEIWRMGPRVIMPHIRYKQLSVIELTSNVMTAIAMAL
jgi:hypothetical protein